MSIEVYSADLSNRHEVTHAISIQMSEYYNKIGKMQMTLPIDDYNIAAFEIGGIVFNIDKDVTYVIENIKYDTTKNRMNVNGFTCNWLLNKRAIVNGCTFDDSVPVESQVYNLINSNLRGLPDIIIGESSGMTETVDFETEDEQLLDTVMDVLDLAELGQRMSWDWQSKKHHFEVYKGADLTEGIHSIVFSEEQGTAQNLVINDDMSEFKNVVYVRGQLNNDEEIVISMGDAEGGDRHEYFLQGLQSQKSDESEDDFRFRLKGEASSEIARSLRKQTFQVDIDPEDYRRLYNLGDEVLCSSERFGLAFKSRITGVKYTLDVTGTKTLLVLGEPTLVSLGKVVING